MEDLNFIKPKHSLRQKEKKEKIKGLITKRVSSIDIRSLRHHNKIDEELVLMICNCVENLVKKKYQIDKKSFVVEILSELFPELNQTEKENISQTCQFLFDNLLIQSVPIVEKAKYHIWNWIKRKIG